MIERIIFQHLIKIIFVLGKKYKFSHFIFIHLLFFCLYISIHYFIISVIYCMSTFNILLFLENMVKEALEKRKNGLDMMVALQALGI